MPNSLDTLPYYRFRLYSQQGGIISAHYSQPQTGRDDHCGTTAGPVVLFSNAEVTWQAVRGAAPHPFTQATMNAAIRHMTPLWTCLPPEHSKKWELDITRLDSNFKPVYFEVLHDGSGSCNHRIPSEPAKADPDHPGKYMYSTFTEAERHFGDLRQIVAAAKSGDRRATRYELAHLNSMGKREYIGTVAVSLFPDSAFPSGDELPTRRFCGISPWDLTKAVREDGTSRETGYVVEDD